MNTPRNRRRLFGVALVVVVLGVAVLVWRPWSGNGGPMEEDGAAGPSTTEAEQELERELPPPALGDDAIAIARDYVNAIAFGALDVEAGAATARAGSTLTSVTVALAYQDREIATTPVLVVINASGSVVSAENDHDRSWETAWQSSANEHSILDATGAKRVAESSLGTSVEVEVDEEVWVPVEDELRPGWRLRVTSAGEGDSGPQRFEVVIDGVSYSTLEIVPLAVHAHHCHESADVDSPSACVGWPDPSAGTTEVSLTHLGNGGLSGDHVRVLRFDDEAAAEEFRHEPPRDLSSVGGFPGRNGRWRAGETDLVYAAATAYHWHTLTAQRLSAGGFQDLVEDPVTIGIVDGSVGGTANYHYGSRTIMHGRVDERHSGADGRVAVHEYGHYLYHLAAPNHALTRTLESVALNEANADVLAVLMTVKADADTTCVSTYVFDSCLRGLHTAETYEEAFSAADDPYAAGRVWSSALLEVFASHRAQLGGTSQRCSEGTACHHAAMDVMYTVIESWYQMNTREAALPDAARALLLANQHLGYLDEAVIQDAFRVRGLLDPPAGPTATVVIQHPSPQDLRVTLDVVDRTGTVICDVGERPGRDVVTFRAVDCDDHLPPTLDTVWRATVSHARETFGGRVMEFSVSFREGGGVSTRPTIADIPAGDGPSVVVTIPEGADTTAQQWTDRLARALSQPVIYQDLERVIAVVGPMPVDESSAATARLVGYNLRSGETEWQAPYSFGATFTGVPASFEAGEEHVYALAESGGVSGVAAYDPASGEQAWFTAVDDPLHPQRCGTAICVPRPGSAERLRLRPSDGTLLDAPPTHGDDLPLASIDQDTVSMTSGRNPTIRRWNPDTGETAWEITPNPDFGASTGGGWNSYHLPDEDIYILSVGSNAGFLESSDGYTVAINPDNGAVLWSLRNAWVPTRFPHEELYVFNYRTSSLGFDSNVTAESVSRINMRNGAVLATASGMADPFRASFVFGVDGTTMWWRDDPEGEISGGHDMRLNLTREAAVRGVGWEVVPLEGAVVAGDTRVAPSGYRALDLASDTTIIVRNQPSWIGPSSASTACHVGEHGGITCLR